MKNYEKGPINELLYYERKRRNWSREYVASKIEIEEVRTVGRWEREGVIPHSKYRQKLCELYGKDARALGFVKPGMVPIWNVPSHRNPFFTGREMILANLRQFLTTAKTATLTQPQAISGLGGIGKTQIALEYAYRYGEGYQAVLWVRAESRDVLTSDFAALAPLLGLSEKDTQDQGWAIAAVKEWLANLTRWLLILDNIEDLQLVSDFIPIQAQGHVLLTTRAQATGSMAHLIEVDALDIDEGVLFLLRRAKIIAHEASPDAASYADQTYARAIGERMGCLPLALDQAGAYIEETRCNLAEYHKLYETRGSVLLKERGALIAGHPEAVVGTFLLSFERVQQTNRAAADLLRLCSFLHPDAIPEEIITDGAAELGPVLAPVASDPLLLDRAIKDLLKYSLVRRNRDVKTLTVHRLVQAVLKDEMEKDAQQKWAEKVVRAVNRALPDFEFSKWQR
ncbi:MAG TPA: NB-ARC domain-containing protein, partial [Ktedonosporobacter sp.]|nr:NB-ARC domain-containing protein [Ktedonosporobacter sp.]